MRIDLASFFFGCSLEDGTGTPPWGTALGQNKPDYKFTHEGYQDVLVGMLYNAVPLKDVWMPIGKGGNVMSGADNQGIQLASVFNNVFVNGIKIGHPFAMVIFKESSVSHMGRRHLKYSPKISFRDANGYVYSNEGFVKEVRNKFGLSEDACWFVYELDLSQQDELHIKAQIVNKESNVVYRDSKERKEVWQALVH